MKLDGIAACLAVAWVFHPSSVLGFQSFPQPHSIASFRSTPRIAKRNHVKFTTAVSYDYQPLAPSTSLVMASDAVAGSDDGQSGNIFEAPGKGILRDYKARLPHFLSDIKDGLNIQVR